MFVNFKRLFNNYKSKIHLLTDDQKSSQSARNKEFVTLKTLHNVCIGR